MVSRNASLNFLSLVFISCGNIHSSTSRNSIVKGKRAKLLKNGKLDAAAPTGSSRGAKPRTVQFFNLLSITVVHISCAQGSGEIVISWYRYLSTPYQDERFLRQENLAKSLKRLKRRYVRPRFSTLYERIHPQWVIRSSASKVDVA